MDDIDVVVKKEKLPDSPIDGLKRDEKTREERVGKKIKVFKETYFLDKKGKKVLKKSRLVSVRKVK